MSLQDKLDAFKADFEAKAPAAAIAAFHRSNEELIASGRADRALQAGDAAPDFTLTDPDGTRVSLRSLLAAGPVVLSFYRGVWCPYCNMELQALEEARGEIEARGATLLAISQQSAPNSRKSQRQNGLNFPILTDRRGAVGDSFGLRWTLPDYLVEVFRSFKVELPALHEDDAWTLPMPARYVIGTDGVIAYAEINPDYTQRPEPSDIFPILDQIARQAA